MTNTNDTEESGNGVGGIHLNIGVIGGGIAGLAAAIALRRAGHYVTVYEQSRMANELGAAIHLAPNATKILLNLGFDPEKARCVLNGISTLMDGKSMAVKTYKPLDHIEPSYGYPWYLIHRVDLHNELKNLAFGPGSGVAAILKTSSRVVDINCDMPSITLADGTIINHDVVIGADGVHSTTVQAVTGQTVTASPTGFSAYRFLVPAENLYNDPQTRWLVEGPKALMASFSIGPKRLATYPCRNRELVNFVAIHPEQDSEEAAEGWNISGDIEGLLSEYADFHPDILALCRHANDLNDLKLWKLLYRRPVSPWNKGRVCVIGDAVHPMLPHQGQGGGMALEDGAALGVLLSNVTSKSDIIPRLQLLEQLRYERTSITQIISNFGFDEVHEAEKEASKYVKNATLPKTQSEIHEFFFRYDVVKDTKAKLESLNRPVTELPITHGKVTKEKN